MLTPRRLRRAPIFLAALLTLLFSVQADVAHAQRGSLLPSQSDVATLFPYLAGGHRSVFAISELTLPLEGCTMSLIVARAHRGEGASFVMQDGTSPNGSQLVDPQPLVYRFASPRVAEKAFEEVLSYVRFCRGRHTDTRAAIRLKRVGDPGLGARSLAWRLSIKGSDGHSTFQSRTAHVAVLRGKDLVWTSLTSPTSPPATDLAVAFARLTLRSSS